MNKKPWLACVKWGVVLGAALAVFELIKMVARNVEYAGAKMFDIALIILMIVVLYAGVKELKEKYTERLTFAKAFLGTIVITIIGSLIFFAYAFVHYNYIDVDGLQKKRQASLKHYRELIENDTIKSVELDNYLDTVQVIIKNEEALVCADTLDADVIKNIHKGIEMIEQVYAEKLQGKRSLDTANHNKMANFQPYARLTLMQTLETYVTQNANQPSTPYVQKAIEQANAQLSTINPVDIRYEQRKNEVPQYDKLSIFIFICTMMNLLYGLFFGIFVALFHYTSKKPANEETVSSTETSDEDLESNSNSN